LIFYVDFHVDFLISSKGVESLIRAERRGEATVG